MGDGASCSGDNAPYRNADQMIKESGVDARASWREGALVVVLFACLTAIATYPLMLHLGRALPGDLGDPLFTSWMLGWDADRLRHGLTGFWDAPFLFPSQHALAFSEHMLGVGLFVAPVIWVTGNPILAHNLAFVFSDVLAGCGMYLLARELTGRRDAAFLAGVAFAFTPIRALHLSHLQILNWGWMPIALWGLHRFFATRSARALAIFAAAFTLQALSNSYFIYYLALASAFVVVYEFISRPAGTGRSAARAGVVGDGRYGHPRVPGTGSHRLSVRPSAVRIRRARTRI